MAYQQFIPRKGRRLTNAAKIVYEDRKVFLAEVGFKTYRSYLASDLWKGIRDKVLAERPLCEFCGAQATQVHHSSYWPSVLRGEVRKALHSVCATCHLFGEFSPTGIKRSPRQAVHFAKQRIYVERKRAEKKQAVPWKVLAHRAARTQGKFEEYMRIQRNVRGNAAKKAAFRELLGAFDAWH